VPGGVWQLVFARDFASASDDPTPYHLAAGGALVAVHVGAANRLFDFVSTLFLSAAERCTFFATAPAGYAALAQGDEENPNESNA